MAVTIIPQVTNWTVTPINGQSNYFTLMNTWLTESTNVIDSLSTSIDAMNLANSEINDLAQETFTARDAAVAAANYQGDWTAGSYNTGQSVSYTDGFIYMSKIDNNTDEPPTSNWLQIPKSLIINDNAVNSENLWSSQKINDELIERDNDISNGLALKVNIAGNETLTGVKTFNDSPVVPTPTNNNHAANKEYVDLLATGKLLQNVFFATGTFAQGTGAIPFDNSIPQITEGTEFLNTDFTPKKNNSKLIIEVILQIAAIGNRRVVASLFKNTDSNALASGWTMTQQNQFPNSISFSTEIDSQDTNLANFSVRMGSEIGDAVYLNGDSSSKLGGTLISSISIKEIGL